MDNLKPFFADDPPGGYGEEYELPDSDKSSPAEEEEYDANNDETFGGNVEAFGSVGMDADLEEFANRVGSVGVGDRG